MSCSRRSAASDHDAWMVFGRRDGYHLRQPSPALGTDFAGLTPLQLNADRYLPCGNWNGNPPPNPCAPALRDRRRGPTRPRDGRRACAKRALAVEGPLGRGARCPDADVVLLCVPDGEIANAAAAIERRAERPARRPLLRRHDARAARPARGFLAAPADDRPGRRTGAASPAPAPRSPAAPPTPAASPTSSRSTSASRRSRSPTRTAPPTTPPPRSPRTSSSRSRPPPSSSPPAPASTAPRSSRSCGRPSRTGPRWAPSARSPARSPAATRRRSTRQRDAIAERTPDLLPLFDALAEATRAPGARRGCAA